MNIDNNLRIECFDCKFSICFNIDNIKFAIDYSERHLSENKFHSLYFIELSDFVKFAVRVAVQ